MNTKPNFRFIICLLSFISCQFITQAKTMPFVPDTTLPKLQHGKVYRAGINIGDYYVSEKLDGVRGYWDGKQLLSRTGNKFSAPNWFTEQFPPTALDGELWIARGMFAETLSVVSRLNAHQGWQDVRYMIFDMPAYQGPFAERVTMMQQLIAGNDSPYLKMIQQIKLSSTEKLENLLTKVINRGGEGLMLHKQSAYYHTGRTDNLLKLKAFQDSEAQVIGHTQGKGKYAGLLGALIVQTPKGTVFKIGSGFSDQQRRNPPAIGTIITYKYWGFTRGGKPRFAAFMRIRKSL
ncbi:DNA ligase [Thalassotalea sp. 42_200_T64]|nr:DNA ligase [Thalassotalea sp. 42_200_T64]